MPQPLQISVLLTFGGHCLLSMEVFSASMKHVVIHPLEQMCLEVLYLRLVPAGSSLPRGFCRGVRAPLVYLRDRRLITVEVSGYLVYVRWRTRVLRGPNFASMCSLEGS